MPRLLIISFVEWAGAFQRPQHLALGLARRGWQVGYVSPGYLHRTRNRVRSGLAFPPNLTVLQPPALPGARGLMFIQKLNVAFMWRALRRLAPTQPWDVVIFNAPHWAELAQRLRARLRIFDCMDDLSLGAPNPHWMERAEARALEVADHVWTGTCSLAERLENRHPSVRFIPCGVDAEHFARPDWKLVERLKVLQPLGEGPLAGYFGVLNERFDMVRLEALLANTDWRVMLIGPATSRAPALPSHPRLRWIGPRPYIEMPAFLAQFDLALIPYHTDGPHRYLYPVKALEYLAGGKPVLSTPLPEIKRFLGDFTEFADTPDQWARAGRRLCEDRTEAQRRAAEGQAFVCRRGWHTMIDEMESCMRESLR